MEEEGSRQDQTQEAATWREVEAEEKKLEISRACIGKSNTWLLWVSLPSLLGFLVFPLSFVLRLALQICNLSLAWYLTIRDLIFLCFSCVEAMLHCVETSVEEWIRKARTIIEIDHDDDRVKSFPPVVECF